MRLSAGIRLEQAELTPGLAATLRHAASMHNPEFYERQRTLAGQAGSRLNVTDQRSPGSGHDFTCTATLTSVQRDAVTEHPESILHGRNLLLNLYFCHGTQH